MAANSASTAGTTSGTVAGTTSIVERLMAHRTMGAAPRAELAWIAERGTLRQFEEGETLIAKGPMPEDHGLWVLLSGHLAAYVDRGAGPKRVMDWEAGDVTGVLPFSRVTSAMGAGIALAGGELLQLHAAHFPALIRECPEVTAILVHQMLDRARQFTSSDLNDEKMLSLGRLAAGLAHELNNPASATVRNATLLAGALEDAVAAAREVGAVRLSVGQQSLLDRFREWCADRANTDQSALSRADREDAIADWLERRGADSSAAAALADACVTTQALDELADGLEPAARVAAIRWVAADHATRAIVSDIRHAASRIYELIDAVKRFTYMDRPAALEAVDVAQGLRDTVSVLTAKANAKPCELALDADAYLPPVRAVGGELNQIWSNLIDNAIDAAPAGGHVQVSARVEANRVVVRMIDDGPGVPAELIERIFDPFFTTKPVGAGTGLGLDVARRLVRRHSGEIDVVSRPGGGRTEFRVSLPVTESRAPS